MNFALLGHDPLLAGLARNLASDERHRLRWACAIGEFRGELLATIPNIELVDEWESLAGEAALEAVILAAPRPESEPTRTGPEGASDEPVRRLAQAGKHLLVVRPEDLSLVTCYELARICDETGSVVLPISTDLLHPALAPFGNPAEAARVGPVRHVTLQRFLREGPGRDRANGKPILESGDGCNPPALLNQFARDVFLLRFVAGEISHVNVLPSPARSERPPSAPSDAGNDTAPTSLCVSMANRHGTMTTWTAVSSRTIPPGAQLTVKSDRAVTTCHWTDLSAGVDVKIETAQGVHSERFGPWDPAANALDQFVRAVAGPRPCSGLSDATNCIDLADAAGRSMRRGRTVELSQEAQTEAGSFKGTMAAVGCGLLGCVLMALVVTAVAEGLGVGWIHYAWYGIVPLLAVFLVLQLLGLIVPRTENAATREHE